MNQVTNPNRAAIISWDWREQIDLDELARNITDLTNGQLHLRKVDDTGSDQYAIVLATVPVSPEQAEQMWSDHQSGEDG